MTFILILTFESYHAKFLPNKKNFYTTIIYTYGRIELMTSYVQVLQNHARHVINIPLFVTTPECSFSTPFVAMSQCSSSSSTLSSSSTTIGTSKTQNMINKD